METGKLSSNSFESVLSMDTETLIDWLYKEFIEIIPFENIENKAHYVEAGRLTMKFANEYAYLSSLYNYAKVRVRKAKASKATPKQCIDDMIDARDSIGRTMEAVKILLKAVSRMVTIKDDIDEELKMTRFME